MKTNQFDYKVLARKYRPKDFDTLVGQPVLVRTISNAIKIDRIAHAFLLTGIRGVGKTTTARIIAKIVNCTNLQFKNDIAIPCHQCVSCCAFDLEKHPDIIEMDAASRTGIGDIREIIENANYLPLIGKIKFYIIDEVHMLSNSAFNALLKTLEEPPAHVKFIFATTELKKIPITVLSRCQRFDLRRLTSIELLEHLKNIMAKERLQANDDSLTIIANHSGGSVRDSLSLLDQAIANSYSENDNVITEQIVRQMLGISNRPRLYDLFLSIITSNIAASLAQLNALYQEGSDPVNLLEELLEITHLVNKYKLDSRLFDNLPMSSFEQDQLNMLANKLEISYLSTLWQMLLKAITELKIASNSLNALEMVIIRLAYSANLPTPLEISQELKKKPNLDQPSVILPENIKTEITNFKQLAQIFYDKKEFLLHHAISEEVSLVEFKPFNVTINLTKDAPKHLVKKMTELLHRWTNNPWQINVTTQSGEESLAKQYEAVDEQNKQQAKNIPIVKAILDNFAGSTIININNDNIPKNLTINSEGA